MLILLINGHMQDSVGGSEIQCNLIANNLHGFDHQVFYGVVRPKSSLYKTPYKCIKINKPFFWSFFKIILKIKPKVVYWRFNKNHLLYSAIVCKIFGVKFVFGASHFKDYERVLPFNFKSIFIAINKPQDLIKLLKYLVIHLKIQSSFFTNYYGFHFVDAIVHQRKDFFGVLPVKNEIVIYNSMSLDKVQFKWKKPYIVWVSNLKPVKNPEVFIKLADSFKDYNLDFLMIGGIQHQKYNYVKEDIQKIPNFHYLGIKSVQEVNGIVSSSLFLVHTCKPEGFSNIFIQAWLQGKPVVSLYFDPDSIIKKKNIGLYSGSIENLILNVKKLCEDEDLREEIGNEAKIFATKNFNPNINLKILEKFLMNIIDS